MNIQIKALLLNARNMFDNGVTDSNNKIYIHGSEENLAKFAELIVRECMDIAYAYDAPKMSGPGMIVANRIEDHFGVEE